MRRVLVSALAAVMLVGFWQSAARSDQASMPAAFTENKGQWDETVRFRANVSGTVIWFTQAGVYYQFIRRIHKNGTLAHDPIIDPLDRLQHGPDSIEQAVVRVSFAGSNGDVEIIGIGLKEHKCNYFIGNNPSKWRTDVPNYSSVLYKELYPGIDLRFSGAGNGRAEYEFVAAPGADLRQIRVEYDGIDKLPVDASGRLVVRTSWGDTIAVMGSPADGAESSSRGPLPVFERTASFDTPAEEVQSTTRLSLTLDYSTYLGGSGYDLGHAIAVDDSGAAYVAGWTLSSSFPTLDPYQMDEAGVDAYISKLSSSGNNLVYSTYIGGSDNDYCSGLAVDSSGAAYMTGETSSTDFPTLNPYQTYQGGLDAYVTKLSSSGNSLVYSTYLGGSDIDYCIDIAVDCSARAYVTGATLSADFPTVDPYQTSQGGSDAFVSKLSSSGNSLVYSTYLGGNSKDYAEGIAVDGSGAAYVTGTTNSLGFPTLNPFQGTFHGDWDVFVSKISSSGNSLVYSTYLGGSFGDASFGIAVDYAGAAYVAGATYSFDFPILNPYQTKRFDRDVFVTKLSVSGNFLVYSTYLGGSGSDLCGDIAVDSHGTAYVTGCTRSADFPTLNSYQTDQEDRDVFVTRFCSSGNSLVYSTYLGGSGWDESYSVAVDGAGAAYVTGRTESADFPTHDPYQTYQGDYDVFVSKLSGDVFLCGDADASVAIDIDDIVCIVQHVFAGGPPPVRLEAGDADCSGAIDIDDAMYLIEAIFSGGNAPCDTDGDGVLDC